MLLTKNALLPKLHAQSNKHALKINLCKITILCICQITVHLLMNTQNSSTVYISLVHSVYLVYNHKITNSKDWEKEIYSITYISLLINWVCVKMLTKLTKDITRVHI